MKGAEEVMGGNINVSVEDPAATGDLGLERRKQHASCAALCNLKLRSRAVSVAART